MSKFSVLDLAIGYERENVADTNGKKFYVNYVTGSATHHVGSKFSRAMSLIFNKLARAVAYTSTRSYGMFLLGFGLLTLLLHFLKEYMNFYDEVPLAVLFIGSLFSLAGIPFLLFDRPLCLAMQEFSLTDFVFFEFFCIQRMHRSENEAALHPVVALVLGLMLAVLGAFVPLYYVVIGILAVVYLYLTFLSPEFSFFLIFLLLPYFPLVPAGELLLTLFVGITFVSFMRKVALGKRVYFFEKYDLLLGLMLVFVLISGVFVKGMESFKGSLLMLGMTMGYMLTGSIVTNRRLADCFTKAVITSSIPLSFMAIGELIAAILGEGIESFSGAHATFDSPSELAMFLLLPLLLSVYFILVRRGRQTKVLYGFIAVLTVLAIVLTLKLWVVGALVVALIAFAVANSRHVSGVLLALMAIVPYTLLLLPSEVLDAFSALPLVDALGIGGYITRWEISRQIFLDNILLGVGIGSECFAPEYAGYTDGFAFPDSGSFLLQIGCEAGVFALLLFLFALATRIKHRTIYLTYVRSSTVSLLSAFTAVITVVLMLLGSFTSIWSNMTMLYLFFCVFGLGSTALRISKQEFDDRIGYYSDGAGADNSSIDIQIK